ncbi:beta-N-acetylhexosaminidase [Saccharospirillum impatiens]|uniref:beta-N-acetylhexosaminidase n=1 Tax=Saccharospirillum impatiens TaxID=169438 RepID=UPI000426F166|nr:family 20 glycosylhydrolase [Saccharospirillum impatiens]
MMLTAELAITTREGHYHLQITLPKTGTATSAATELCFCMAHPPTAESVSGAQLLDAQGDWHRLALATPWTGEHPVTLSFSGKGELKKLTDRPYGVYLVQGQQRLPVQFPGEPARHFIQPAEVKSNTLSFLPRPRQSDIGQGRMHCPSTLQFLDSTTGPAWNTGWFQRLSSRLSVPAPTLSEQGYLIHARCEPGLPERFQLHISEQNAELRYRDDAGFYAGQAYLMQYLLQWPLAGTLPELTIADTPDFDYRGVHLDVVRHFFEADTVQHWLDIIALFQFNHFHWHLTDDDGWRVPSARYPELERVAAWRGHDLPVCPQMGSGSAPYGGVYTESEIRSTVARAQELGITIVPELDIPGHARALLIALPELDEPDDTSLYHSVQHHKRNVINPALSSTTKVMQTLLDEWCALFPGPLLHLGSDEVPDGVWRGSPAAQAWSANTGLPIDTLHGHFMAQMESEVQRRGKTAVGWEEMRTGEAISTDTWIMSWQGIEAGQAAAEAGHPVVMTPASHCYFDLAVTDQADDPGYYWAGTVSLQQAWHYDPTAGLSEPAKARVKGVQACLWTELVETPEHAEYMWFPRLLATAEVAWGATPGRQFSDFESDARVIMNLLAHLGITGRDEQAGW